MYIAQIATAPDSSFDIDDLILNFMGFVIGFALWKSKVGQKVYRYIFE